MVAIVLELLECKKKKHWPIITNVKKVYWRKCYS
jgi:hypothetical protein